ncbi:MAG: nucleoside hydrolase [Bryobacteraceae bacterium]
MRHTFLLTVILLVQIAVPVPLTGQVPVILDTDMGDDIDDALALAFALKSPELKILAITTVLQQGQRRADLTWKILEQHGRTDIPIGVGAEQTLLGEPSDQTVRQTLALGAGDQQPEDKRQNGLRLMIDTILNSQEKVTVLAYGPLTNVALALRSEPRIRPKIQRIVLMNGVFFTPRLEYNTIRDPEASAIVYSSGLPITTVGLDVTLQCRMEEADLARFRDSQLPNVQFLYQLIEIWQQGKTDQRPILHDPLAVAITFRPELIRTSPGRVNVELNGTPKQTYGMTLFKEDQQAKTRVAAEVEERAFLDLFVERVTTGAAKSAPAQ